MLQSDILFAKTNPLKLFFRAAIPGTLGMLAGSIYGLLEGIFVGQFIGETAFAALNIAFPFVVINFSLADLIGVGSAVPISIYMGQGKDREADNTFTAAVFMIIAAGILMDTLMFFAAPFLIKMLGAEGELAKAAVEYIRIYALFSPATTIFFAMDNYWRICGKIRGSMVLNILFSFLAGVFVFFFVVILEFGVTGAALATCLSMILGVGIAIYPFIKGKERLHFIKPEFSLELVKRILTTGLPTFLSNIAGRLTSIVLNMVLIFQGGEEAVAIYGILMYVGDIVQMILYGICDSLQPAIGYNWGAGMRDRVKSIAKYCFTGSALISIFSAAMMFAFPEKAAALFINSNDSSMISASSGAIILFSLTFLTRWIGFAAQSFLVAINQPLPATVLSVANALVIPLILILILWPLKLMGIWMNFPLTSLVVAILAIILLIRIGKEKEK